VTNKIGGFENRPVLVSTDRKVVRSEDAPANPAGTTAASDPVRITDEAKQLAALEQAIKSMPAIDEQRVAEVRRQLDEGRYEVNPGRIADKLLRFERDLSI
jgi:negative regulator of flagellin synthesis FlgM